MRIREVSDIGPDGKKKKGPGTRADRANEHAAKRIHDRHAERDYFGHVIDPQANKPELSPAAAKRAIDGTVRLDAYLVGRGMAPSRDKAKVLIDEGRVYVDGKNNKVKPSMAIALGMVVEVRDSESPELA